MNGCMVTYILRYQKLRELREGGVGESREAQRVLYK